MPTPSKIKVTVSGPHGLHRTRQIAALIEGYLFINNIDDVAIGIVELQPQFNPPAPKPATVAALTIKIDTSQVPDAVAALDRVTSAANNAVNALARLNAAQRERVL
jgi:hypothetical protein